MNYCASVVPELDQDVFFPASHDEMEGLKRPLNAVPKVYVVDDDRGSCDGLRMLLESDGIQVETFASGGQFLRSDLSTDGPACIVLDLVLADMNGLDVHAELRRRGNEMPVVYLTGYGSIRQAVRAMQQGAADFLTKPVNPFELLKTLRLLLRTGSKPMDKPTGPSEQAPVGTNGVGADLLANLTSRERQVLDRVLAGRSNKLIARELGISFRTVELHRSHILHKTGKRSMMQLSNVVFSSANSLDSRLRDHVSAGITAA